MPPTVLEVEHVLPLPISLLKAALAHKRARESPELARIEVHSARLPVDRAKVAAYRRVCGERAAATLPLLYPQVLAAPLHLLLMSHETFPFASLGLIHVANRVAQKRPLREDEPLSVQVVAEGARPVRSGHEVDLVTRVAASGEDVWESTMTVLSRQDRSAPAEPKKRAPVELPLGTRTLLWRVPADRGRSYARVSGDFNPIHLSALAARAFGFPRAIAHGMWTLARCTAELETEAARPLALEASFRKPLLLPSTVMFHSYDAAGATEFRVTSEDGTLLMLTGTSRTG